MLPRGLYEFVPYLYMLFGLGLILAYRGLATLPGTLLYLFGAWVWVLRSERRRRSSTIPRRGRARLGQNFYEFLPFAYILAGVYLQAFLDHSIRLISAPLVVAVGVLLLLIRWNARRKVPVPKPSAQVEGVSQRQTTPAAPGEGRPSADRAPTYARVVDDEPLKLRFEPQPRLCDKCVIRDICAGVLLKDESISEIMRLSQTIAPHEGYELIRAAVERIEGQPLDDRELQPILEKLYSYSNLCATWRRTGRHL